jgi:hypothetical protein
MKDWRTTVVGLIVIAVGAIHALQAKAIDSVTMGMLSGGVGLILAKDSKA